MDKRKFIGTIIGVIMFAALIAGATFAWFTLTANVTNGNYTASTKNFIINYGKGTEVGNVVVTDNATTATIATAPSANDEDDDPSNDEMFKDGWLAVSAAKTANSAKASSFMVKMHVNSNGLTTKAVTWAICKGDCPTNVALATVSNGTATCGTGVTNCGTVDAGASNTDITLFNDTSTFNTDDAVSEQTYNVYVWVDAATTTNTDLGKTFSGYIHASATQGD